MFLSPYVWNLPTLMVRNGFQGMTLHLWTLVYVASSDTANDVSRDPDYGHNSALAVCLLQRFISILNINTITWLKINLRTMTGNRVML